MWRGRRIGIIRLAGEFSRGFSCFGGLSIGLVEIGGLGDFEKYSNRFIRWLAKSINQYDGLGKTSAIVVIKMKREREKKANETSLSQLNSEHWSSGETNRQQGRAWLDQIYKSNHASTENTLAAHKDFCKSNIEINSKPPIDRGFLPTTNYSLTNPFLLITNSLALHRNHLRPLPLRPQHPRRRRHGARRARRDHDAESPAGDGVAFERDEADWSFIRGRGDGAAVCKFFLAVLHL